MKAKIALLTLVTLLVLPFSTAFADYSSTLSLKNSDGDYVLQPSVLDVVPGKSYDLRFNIRNTDYEGTMLEVKLLDYVSDGSVAPLVNTELKDQEIAKWFSFPKTVVMDSPTVSVDVAVNVPRDADLIAHHPYFLFKFVGDGVPVKADSVGSTGIGAYADVVVQLGRMMVLNVNEADIAEEVVVVAEEGSSNTLPYVVVIVIVVLALLLFAKSKGKK